MNNSINRKSPEIEGGTTKSGLTALHGMGITVYLTSRRSVNVAVVPAKIQLTAVLILFSLSNAVKDALSLPIERERLFVV